MKHLFTLLLVAISLNTFCQTSWYVNLQTGSNSNSGTTPSNPVKTVDHLLSNGLVQPGDTVFIMGQYNNPDYDPDFVYGGNDDRNNPHIWNAETSIKISNLHGNQNNYITFRPYDSNTVLKGDGSNIIRIINSSYINIEGFDIYGEVENIPLSEAEGLETDGMQFLYLDSNTVDELHPTLEEVLFRVEVGTTIEEIENMTFPIIGSIKRPSYIDTRGIYATDCDNLKIIGNTIHHTPGVGLRVAECSNTLIELNDIHDCSRRSYSGTHALVATKTMPGSLKKDDGSIYSVIIRRNNIHNNYNEIFSWVGTKDFITPRIDEGKGISLQRNDIEEWQNCGERILVENNVCYWNGFSGVHSNDGYHIDFINNTCYMNSYTNTVTYANEDQQGNNIGISTQRGNDIRIINNISVIDNDWGGFAISAGNSSNLFISDNLIYGVDGEPAQDPDVTAIEVNTIVSDPLFVNPQDNDFNLSKNSPAIGAANPQYAPVDDFYGENRDTEPDLGAIEYFVTSMKEEAGNSTFKVYPNPFNDKIVILGKSDKKEDVSIYDIQGKNLTKQISINTSENRIELNTSKLKNGTYLIKVNNSANLLIKK